jgi:DNA-binding MarR family transcriptional regulator
MRPTTESRDLIDRAARECLAVRARLISRVMSGLYDEAFRPHGLRVSQGNILLTVAHRGEARPAEICRILRIEKSTLSRDVELMRQKGWLKTETLHGGRNQTLRLTRKGRALLQQIQPAWEQAQAEAKRLLGEAGVTALRDVASRLGFGKPNE